MFVRKVHAAKATTLAGGISLVGLMFTACGETKFSKSSRGPAETVAQENVEALDDGEALDDELPLHKNFRVCRDANTLDKITVSPSGSVLINDPRVIGDDRAKGRGPWSFAFLMREILELNPDPKNDSALLTKEDAAVKNFIEQFVTPSPVNTFTAAPRTATKDILLKNWPKVQGLDGKMYLVFENAPLKLSAITNRLDISKKRGLFALTAGEGRFIFEFTVATVADAPKSTLIFEFDLPIGYANAHDSSSKLVYWVRKWQRLKQFLEDTDPKRPGVQPSQALGDLKFNNPADPKSLQGQAGYLAALEALTNQFTKRTSLRLPVKGNPRRSALSQIRTNEIFQEPWELREMIREVSAAGVALKLTTVKNNPDLSFSGPRNQGQNAKLAAFDAWIEDNVRCERGAAGCRIVARGSLGEIPEKISVGSRGAITTFAVLGASAPNLLDKNTLKDPVQWFPGSTNIKHRFVALNTCDGCHGVETQTAFIHIASDGKISKFLTDDVVRRQQSMRNLICLTETSRKDLSVSSEDLEDLRVLTSNSTH